MLNLACNQNKLIYVLTLVMNSIGHIFIIRMH